MRCLWSAFFFFFSKNFLIIYSGFSFEDSYSEETFTFLMILGMPKKGRLLVVIFFWGMGMASASDFPFFLGQGKISPLTTQIPRTCAYYERKGEKILVNPSCILEGKIPQLSLKDRIDAVWNSISRIGTGYLSHQAFMVYRPESVEIKSENTLFPLSKQRRNALLSAQKENKKAELPLSIFAEPSKSSLAFFIADKDISQLKPCTKTNYLLAFENLDGKRIKAGSEFNFNHYLFGLRGYCQGQGSLDLKFYGGVCGVSSQLFRAALTSPVLQIPLRRGHNERFSAYYGDSVEGDDAAVYETSKQFILRNISDEDIFIKTFQKDQKTFLAFITEQKTVDGKWVEVQKVYESPLQVSIIKHIYQKPIFQKSFSWFYSLPNFSSSDEKKATKVIGSELFVSRYLKVNHELR